MYKNSENFSEIIKNIFGSTINFIINQENKNNSFWYTVVFIFTVYLISNLEISNGVIYGSFIGIIVIYILSYNNVKNDLEIKELEKIKLNSIEPQPLHSPKEIINYLFSIQDFYEYNPQAYEDMVENIDNFFERYNETLKDRSLSGANYGLMEEYESNIINSLHSIIYKIRPNKEYDKKLNDAIKKIRVMLGKYLNEVIFMNNKFIYENGIKNNTKFISKSKVKPINFYLDENTDGFKII